MAVMPGIWDHVVVGLICSMHTDFEHIKRESNSQSSSNILLVFFFTIDLMPIANYSNLMDSSQKVEILLVEYKAANDGYNSRDDIVFHEFNVMAALILALILIINYTPNVFPNLGIYKPYFFLVIGYVGFIALLALSIHLTSAYSAKQAIRRRLNEIEEQLNSYVLVEEKIKLWHDSIALRNNKYPIEQFKRFLLFPSCSVIFIIIWIFYIFFNLYVGDFFLLILFAILIMITLGCLKK